MDNIGYLAEKLNKTEQETTEWLTNLVKNTGISVHEMATALLQGIQYQEAERATPNLDILRPPSLDLEQQRYVVEPTPFYKFYGTKMQQRRKKRK